MGALRSLMTFLAGAVGGGVAAVYYLRRQAPAQTGATAPGALAPGAAPVTPQGTPRVMRPEAPPLGPAAEQGFTGGAATRVGAASLGLTAPAAGSGDELVEELRAQIAGQEQLIHSLREELAAAQGWQSRAPTLARFGQTLGKLPSFKAAAADAAIAATRLPAVTTNCDDLAAVYGIGAAYEQRLYAAGVGTFWELAHLTDEDFERILRPTPLQRSTLNLGAIRQDAARLAGLANEVGLLWSGETPDDFEPIKGIGKVFEQRLYEAGVRTYRALATLTVEELAAICHSEQMPVAPDYADWIAQAQALAVQRQA